MNRRAFVTGLGTLLAVPLAAEAQQTSRVPRIAFLAGGSLSSDALLIETFWGRLKALGYIEGANIAADYRFAEGVPERLQDFAAELVRLRVDVIVAPGSGAVAAKKATNTVPIVVAYGDPLGSGLVASLARPGGNVTGLSGFVSELGGKQLQVLKETFPGQGVACGCSLVQLVGCRSRRTLAGRDEGRSRCIPYDTATLGTARSR
jgi:ABC-type uncharacterized transport system substrate-binding protein